MYTTILIITFLSLISSIFSSGIWTEYYGSSGGYGFGEFEADTDENNIFQRYVYINEICTKSGQYLDSIKVEFNDDTYTTWIGGSGGDYTDCYQVNDRECFTSVTIGYGDVSIIANWVHFIQFGTSDGLTTPIWGGNYLYNTDMISYGDGYCITKISVYYGNYIDRMRFYFSERQSIPSSPPTSSISIPSIPSIPSTVSQGGNGAVDMNNICQLSILISLLLLYFMC